MNCENENITGNENVIGEIVIDHEQITIVHWVKRTTYNLRSTFKRITIHSTMSGKINHLPKQKRRDIA